MAYVNAVTFTSHNQRTFHRYIIFLTDLSNDPEEGWSGSSGVDQ